MDRQNRKIERYGEKERWRDRKMDLMENVSANGKGEKEAGCREAAASCRMEAIGLGQRLIQKIL